MTQPLTRRGPKQTKGFGPVREIRGSLSQPRFAELTGIPFGTVKRCEIEGRLPRDPEQRARLERFKRGEAEPRRYTVEELRGFAREFGVTPYGTPGMAQNVSKFVDWLEVRHSNPVPWEAPMFEPIGDVLARRRGAK